MYKIGSEPISYKVQNNPEFQSQQKKDVSPILGLSLAQIRNIFAEILKNIPTDQRYVAVKIHSPQIVLAFRKTYRRIDNQKSNLSMIRKEDAYQDKKISSKSSKNFFQGIVLMTDTQYLDSIGFDFNLVQCPEKLFDFLMLFNDQKYLSQTLSDLIKQKACQQQTVLSLQKSTSKQELAILLSKILRENIIPEIVTYKGNRRLQDQKNKKRDFTTAWKNFSQENRMKLLYLGKQDCKELTNMLIDLKALIPSFQEMQKQVIDLLKSDKNEFCNKIFKSRLKKHNILLEDYHELLYHAWKKEVMKKKKKKSNNYNYSQHNHNHMGGNQNNSHKIKKQKNKRNKSIGAESNETNETQYRQDFSLDVQELIRMKTNYDIINFSDRISQNANIFFDRKVQAFSRLEYLLQTYFHTDLHLFGSLACGLAVDNSDIDVAIDQSFLEHFQYLQDGKKVSAALEFLTNNLESRPWIKNIKLISKASIPIINLTIDTSIKMCEEYMTQQDFLRLNNSSNPGQIDVDLTIQTKKESLGPMHLGLISTKKLNNWLQQYQKLQEITIILKYYLTKRQLNNTYKGGLKTYSLVIMIIAYMKANKLQNCGSIETILKGLTKFYGSQFDQNQTGIDLFNKDIFYFKLKSQMNSAALQIKDPINQKIMTKSCYSFNSIKKLFLEIYEKCFVHTKFEMECFCSGLNPKTKKLILHQVLEEYNRLFPYNNFLRLLEEDQGQL